MPGFYEIKVLPDGPVTRFAGSRGNYYEFADGGHLDVETTPVWCHRCGKVTHGEAIEPLAEIDKRLAELHDSGSELHRFTLVSLLPPDLEHLMPTEKFRLDLVEKAQKRRAWREQRQSAPKCIHCGSSGLVVLPISEPVPHPNGNGTIEVGVGGMCSTNFNE